MASTLNTHAPKHDSIWIIGLFTLATGTECSSNQITSQPITGYVLYITVYHYVGIFYIILKDNNNMCIILIYNFRLTTIKI
jgi:hypothetical protein